MGGGMLRVYTLRVRIPRILGGDLERASRARGEPHGESPARRTPKKAPGASGAQKVWAGIPMHGRDPNWHEGDLDGRSSRKEKPRCGIWMRKGDLDA